MGPPIIWLDHVPTTSRPQGMSHEGDMWLTRCLDGSTWSLAPATDNGTKHGWRLKYTVHLPGYEVIEARAI